jgi:hypothetical protein
MVDEKIEDGNKTIDEHSEKEEKTPDTDKQEFEDKFNIEVDGKDVEVKVDKDGNPNISEEYAGIKDKIEHALNNLGKSQKVLMENNKKDKEIETLKEKLEKLEKSINQQPKDNGEHQETKPYTERYETELFKHLGVNNWQEARDLQDEDYGKYKRAEIATEQKLAQQEANSSKQEITREAYNQMVLKGLDESVKNSGYEPARIRAWCKAKNLPYNNDTIRYYKIDNPKRDINQNINKIANLRKHKVKILKTGDIEPTPTPKENPEEQEINILKDIADKNWNN